MRIRKMKGFLNRILSVSLSVFMFACVLSACGENTLLPATYKKVNNSLLESDSLSNNLKYELSWEKDAKAVVLKSADAKAIWSDILYESFLEGSVSANGNSPICITVYNTQTLKTNTIRSYSEIPENGSIVCKKIENGIRVSYFFDKYEIAIPVDYVLREDSLTVTVDSSKIMESGVSYKLVSVSLVPFMCSVENKAQNGSLFIPTGSGALMYSAETAEGTKKYSGEVYGDDGTRQVPESFYDNEAIRLPVFGASGGGKGMLGIIEQGAGAAVIEAQASNENLGYSNVYSTFYVRGYDKFETDSNVTEKISTRFSEEVSGDVFTIGFYPLLGEDANYNGMAKLYREYLIKNGALKENEVINSPYSITILGGTTITKSFFGIPYKKVVALTDFMEAKRIIEDVNNMVGISPTVRMMGYSDNGLRPGTIAGGKKYQDVYGGKKEINFLQDYCEKEKIDIFMDFEIVRFSKSGSGFSLKSDTAKTAILKRISHYSLTPTRLKDEKNTYNIISRACLKDAAQLAFSKVKKYGNTAVSFSSLGSIAFSDYSSKDNYNKNKIEEDVTSIFNSAKKNGYKVASASANSYAACASDILFDTVSNNGNYNVFDKEIPFYQMVFHSYKTMYTDAANLSENIDKMVMKAAAYGMGLGFTVNEHYMEESNDLDEYRYYGTVYEDNQDTIYKYLVDNGFVDVYNKTADSFLEEYIMLENGISISVYSNKVKVYANHTSETVESPVGNLEGYSFIVK